MFTLLISHKAYLIFRIFIVLAASFLPPRSTIFISLVYLIAAITHLIMPLTSRGIMPFDYAVKGPFHIAGTITAVCSIVAGGNLVAFISCRDYSTFAVCLVVVDILNVANIPSL